MRALLQNLHRHLHALSGVELAEADWAPVPRRELGDVAIPCFKLAKALGKAPPQVAQELAQKLKEIIDAGQLPLAREVRAVGPYLNVFVAAEAYAREIGQSLARDPRRYGGSRKGDGKTVVIDFSSPNVAKEIGLHHIRSTALGNALANIAECHGYKAVRLNYLGDWGTTHGKLILGLKMYSDESKLEGGGLKEMLDIYVRFNRDEKENPKLSEDAKEAFRKLEEGDAESRRIWKLFRDISIREFKRLYDRLGIRFDHFDGESLYNDRMEPRIKEIQDKIGTRVSEGALVCDLPGHKIPVLLRKDDGASLYITRDLAAAEDRWERFHPDHYWYVVAVQQKLHFQQLFDILKILGKPYAANMEHVWFGMLAFGSKTMKTREGNVIILKDVLDEAKTRARAAIDAKNPGLARADEVAEMIGTGAVLFSDLSQHRTHDVSFDWDKALSFEGDTAPFAQYSHARCNSLLRKGEAHRATLTAAPDAAARSALFEEEPVRNLVTELGFYASYLERALADRDPSQVATSVLVVAKAMNHLYHKVRFLDEKQPARLEALLELTRLTRDTLAHGLDLLGIRAPEEM